MVADCYFTERELQRCSKCYGWGHSWLVCANSEFITHEEWKDLQDVREPHKEKLIFEEYKCRLYEVKRSLSRKFRVRQQAKSLKIEEKSIQPIDVPQSKEVKEESLVGETEHKHKVVATLTRDKEDLHGDKAIAILQVNKIFNETYVDDLVEEEFCFDPTQPPRFDEALIKDQIEVFNLEEPKELMEEQDMSTEWNSSPNLLSSIWQDPVEKFMENPSMEEIILRLQGDLHMTKDGQPISLLARSVLPNGSCVKMHAKFQNFVFDPGGNLLHLEARTLRFEGESFQKKERMMQED